MRILYSGSKSYATVLIDKQFKIQDFKYTRWQSVYNDIIEQNAGPLDNILAILSIFKDNISDSCEIIGTTQSEAILYPLMSSSMN